MAHSPTSIMHLIWALPRRGAERVATDLARGIHAENRFRVTVGCLTDTGPLADELVAAGIEVVHFHKKPGLDFSVIPRLVKEIQAREIRLLHTHLFTANLWGRLAARKAGLTAVVSHEHSTFTLDRYWRRLVDKQLVSYSQKIITVSAELREKFLQAGYPPEPFVTIRNGVTIDETLPETIKKNLPTATALDLRQAARKQFEVARDDTVVVIVGSLEPRKDHAMLIRAWAFFSAALRQQGRAAKLLIAGDGPLRAELTTLASGDESVCFLGNISEVATLLATADLYVSSSQTEGTSIALLEAMAAGVPIVATAVGGNPEVLEAGAAGRLAPAGQADSFAAAMLASVSDQATTQRLVATARQRVRREYSLQATVARTISVYAELL